MKKKRSRPAKPPASFLIRYPQLLWGWVALAAWGLEQYLHALKGEPFSPLLFAKGVLLLAGASVVYHLWSIRGYFFLGMFPLLWLAVSKFQWNLCAIPDHHYWLWLALLLLSEILILAFPDGKKLLLLLAPLWVLQAWLFRFSLLLPLTFLRLPEGWLTPFRNARGWFLSEKRMRITSWGKGPSSVLLWMGWMMSCFLVLGLGAGLVGFFPLALIPLVFLLSPGHRLKGQGWVGWGGGVLALVLILLFRGGQHLNFDWFRAEEFFLENRFASFFLLGLLGLVSFPPRKGLRHSAFVLFLATLGFQFWPGPVAYSGWTDGTLLWTLVFFAGPGLESIRVNLMDPSWHGRMVWAALGLAFFGGVM